jgi:hypothetical protein
MNGICCYTVAGVLTALLTGCAQPAKTLYLWETFPKQQYDILVRKGVSASTQLSEMQVHADKARSLGVSLPPGFRAHMGMLYLSLGNPDQAQQLWQEEKASFPESIFYIDQLLKRLEQKPAMKASPA